MVVPPAEEGVVAPAISPLPGFSLAGAFSRANFGTCSIKFKPALFASLASTLFFWEGPGEGLATGILFGAAPAFSTDSYEGRAILLLDVGVGAGTGTGACIELALPEPEPEVPPGAGATAGLWLFLLTIFGARGGISPPLFSVLFGT